MESSHHHFVDELGRQKKGVFSSKHIGLTHNYFEITNIRMHRGCFVICSFKIVKEMEAWKTSQNNSIPISCIAENPCLTEATTGLGYWSSLLLVSLFYLPNYDSEFFLGENASESLCVLTVMDEKTNTHWSFWNCKWELSIPLHSMVFVCFTRHGAIIGFWFHLRISAGAPERTRTELEVDSISCLQGIKLEFEVHRHRLVWRL